MGGPIARDKEKLLQKNGQRSFIGVKTEALSNEMKVGEIRNYHTIR